jgi:hypothetical protein
MTNEFLLSSIHSLYKICYKAFIIMPGILFLKFSNGRAALSIFSRAEKAKASALAAPREG